MSTTDELFGSIVEGEADVERVRALLELEPTAVDAVDGDGFTALHLAAWYGHPKVAELLLTHGADVERVAANPSAVRPLHSAAAGGHLVIVHLMLDRGADIEAEQTGGVRPLHSAAHRDDRAMVELLLGRGADPAAALDDGRTARDLATDLAVVALLPPPASA